MLLCQEHPEIGIKVQRGSTGYTNPAETGAREAPAGPPGPTCLSPALPASLPNRKWAPIRTSWPEGRACHSSMTAMAAEEAR